MKLAILLAALLVGCAPVRTEEALLEDARIHKFLDEHYGDPIYSDVWTHRYCTDFKSGEWVPVLCRRDHLLLHVEVKYMKWLDAGKVGK